MPANFLYFNIFFKSNVYTQFTIFIIYNLLLNLSLLWLWYRISKKNRWYLGDLMTWYFMRTSACNLKKELGIAFHDCHSSGHSPSYERTWLVVPPNWEFLTVACMRVATLLLRDIQPQSCSLGTEMLGTSTCWLHMWPAWFAVPLKCLSNAGRVKETTFGFFSWRQRTTFSIAWKNVLAKIIPIISGGDQRRS